MARCDLCGNNASDADELIQHEGKGICGMCRDPYFQRLREGVNQPYSASFLSRLGVVVTHLIWTVLVDCLLLASVGALLQASNTVVNSDDATIGIRAILEFGVALVSVLLGSFGAAVITVRLAMKRFHLEDKSAAESLQPVFYLILGTTGLPFGLIYYLIRGSDGVGRLLAAMLSPWFFTLIFACSYLSWMKRRAT